VLLVVLVQHHQSLAVQSHTQVVVVRVGIQTPQTILLVVLLLVAVVLVVAETILVLLEQRTLVAVVVVVEAAKTQWVDCVEKTARLVVRVSWFSVT
jgi:hypothetical protein